MIFFSTIDLSLTLNSPVKYYSLIHAKKKLYYIEIAKYTAGITKLKWNIFYCVLYT